MQKFDVVVVGGSVSGSAVALHCARAGLSVCVVEEHPLPGKYGRCTAIVSRKGLDSIGADYSSSTLNEIHGADIRAAGTHMGVRTGKVQALVLDRFKFDEACAKAAQKAGAKFLFDTRFESFLEDESGFSVSCKRPKNKAAQKFRCKVLVGADGANSAVARAACFPAFRDRDYAFCYEAEYADAKVPAVGKVQVFLDSERLSGFFGWTVPCSESVVRVGLGTTNRRGLLYSKAAFLSRPEVRALLGARAMARREFYAMIPLRPRKRTQLGNVLLVGDAAGQAKASTGGGIVFASRCAKVAADEIVAFVKRKQPIRYEQRWRKAYGRKLALHRGIRSFFDALGNRGLSSLLALGKVLGLGAVLERFGDMDEVFSA
ncbi:MAG: NAD(P)/FAD-dependent oxidoreductase [Candidatus Micrarchaeia archaeon]